MSEELRKDEMEALLGVEANVQFWRSGKTYYWVSPETTEVLAKALRRLSSRPSEVEELRQKLTDAVQLANTHYDGKVRYRDKWAKEKARAEAAEKDAALWKKQSDSDHAALKVAEARISELEKERDTHGNEAAAHRMELEDKDEKIEELTRERDEWKAVAQGRTVSCVCGGQARIAELETQGEALTARVKRLASFHVPSNHEHETGDVNPDGPCWVCELQTIRTPPPSRPESKCAECGGRGEVPFKMTFGIGAGFVPCPSCKKSRCAECCKKFDNSYGEMLAPMIVVCTKCWNDEATSRKALRSAEAVIEAATTWRSFESAPKTGEEILIRYPHQGNVLELCSWNRLYGYWASKGKVIFPEEQKCEWIAIPGRALEKSRQSGGGV